MVVNTVLDRCFKVSRERLYYIARLAGEESASLRSLGLAVGPASAKPRIIRTIAGHLLPGMTLSPGSAMLLYCLIDRAGSNLMLMNNLR